MDRLIKLARAAIKSKQQLPYSIYYCKKAQHIRRIPILEPCIVFILNGQKKLGAEINATCNKGQFVFLTENPDVTISNHPADDEYLALIVSFDYKDFENTNRTINKPTNNEDRFLIGHMDNTLITCLTQFMVWGEISPKTLWGARRKELINLLCLSGFEKITSMLDKQKVHHKLIDVFKENPAIRWNIKDMSQTLAMSESTLRRKLHAEGTNFRALNIQVRLANGIHLLQTTNLSIASISEKCGYQSHSRFSETFRDRFGITPVKLRQTILND